MSTFKDRLELLMKKMDTNPNELSVKLGTSAVNLYGYLKGRADYPSMKMLNKFEQIGVSSKWLTTGEGEMFLATAEETSKATTSIDTTYLMEALARIEASFKGDLEEKDRIIKDQRYLIDALRSQLQGGKVNFLEPVITEPQIKEEYATAA